MKRKILIPLSAVVIAASLSGCVKLWEDERMETIPLPETGITTTPEPWEQGGTQEGNEYE
jgi:hypothetical protein